MKKGNRKHRKNTRKVKPTSIEDELIIQLGKEIRRELDMKILSNILDVCPVAFRVGIL